MQTSCVKFSGLTVQKPADNQPSVLDSHKIQKAIGIYQPKFDKQTGLDVVIAVNTVDSPVMPKGALYAKLVKKSESGRSTGTYAILVPGKLQTWNGFFKELLTLAPLSPKEISQRTQKSHGIFAGRELLREMFKPTEQ